MAVKLLFCGRWGGQWWKVVLFLGEGRGCLCMNYLKKIGWVSTQFQLLLMSVPNNIIKFTYHAGILVTPFPYSLDYQINIIEFQMKTLRIIAFLIIILHLTAFDLPQCTTNCSVAHCIQCGTAVCSSCALGYSLALGQCQPNNCPIANCSLCDTQAKCLSCTDVYSTFNSNTNQCLRNCILPNCALCKPSSEKCEECSNGYAVYHWNDRCTPSVITNCLVLFDFRQQQFMCLRCRAGLIPSEDQTECVANSCHTIKNCLACNSSVCSTCRVGYTLNSNGSGCQPNPCSAPNCLYCTSSGLCQRCLSNYTLANGSCTISSCNLNNCLVCKANSQFCDVCKSGYTINVWTNQCQIPTFSITNCQAFMIDSSNQVRCVLCDAGMVPSADRFSCVIDCPPACANCSAGNCSFCALGYSLSSNNSCSANTCTTQGCILCSANQTCLKCNNYTALSSNFLCVSSCTLAHCSTCRNNSSECEECDPGFAVYEWNKKCIKSLIKGCLNIYDFAQQEFMCLKCSAGHIPSANRLSCLPLNCTVPYCSSCSSGLCQTCSEGYQLSANKSQCTPYSCPISHCLLCGSSQQCIRCSSNYALSNGYCILAQCLLPDCHTCKPESIFCDECSSGDQLSIWSGQCVEIEELKQQQQEEQNDRMYIGVFVSVGMVLLVVVLIIIYCIYRDRKMKELAIKNTTEDLEIEAKMQANKQLAFQEQLSEAVFQTAKKKIRSQNRNHTETNFKMKEQGENPFISPLPQDDSLAKNFQSEMQEGNNAQIQPQAVPAFNPTAQLSSPEKQSNKEHQFEFIE